jgi:hypothetical protein
MALYCVLSGKTLEHKLLGNKMNPRPSLNKQSVSEDGSDDDYHLSPDEHPRYDLVLRMVLWGESRDEVFQRLAANGVTEVVAEQLYEQARADRIRTIRSDYSRKFLVGVGYIALAVVIFSVCWFGLGFIPRILLYACFAALGIGSWKAIDSFIGYLMAPSKTGSVADDN